MSLLSDIELMRLALGEAEESPFSVRPNPRVGAALQTSGGKIFKGFHARYGGPHAEIEAISKARLEGVSLRGAQMAVTLEPCVHFGKTAPCVDTLIGEGFSKILIGSLDPNPIVAGKGIQKLKEAGIEVVENLLEAECRSLNEDWLRSYHLGRPVIRVKMATSLDGAWSANDGSSKWITGAEARQAGHLLRFRSEAIVSTGSTLRADNSKLTARGPDGALLSLQPKPFVLSRSSLDKGLEIFKHPEPVQIQKLQDFSQKSLEAFFKELLVKSNIHSVLVEAGPTFTQKLLNLGIWDEIELFMAASLLGGPKSQRLGGDGAIFGEGKLPGIQIKVLEISALSAKDMHIRLGPGPT